MDAIDGDILALVFVTMRQEDRATLLGFEEADLGANQRLEDDVLAALPGVQRLTSTLVAEHVVRERPHPTDESHR